MKRLTFRASPSRELHTAARGAVCPPSAAAPCAPAPGRSCTSPPPPPSLPPSRPRFPPPWIKLTFLWLGCRTARCYSCLWRTCLQRAPIVTHLSTHHNLPGHSPVTMVTQAASSPIGCPAVRDTPAHHGNCQ